MFAESSSVPAARVLSLAGGEDPAYRVGEAEATEEPLVGVAAHLHVSAGRVPLSVPASPAWRGAGWGGGGVRGVGADVEGLRAVGGGAGHGTGLRRAGAGVANAGEETGWRGGGALEGL